MSKGFGDGLHPNARLPSPKGPARIPHTDNPTPPAHTITDRGITITIPAGHLRLSEVKARPGWQRIDARTALHAHELTLDGPLGPSTSPRYYPAAAVAQFEDTEAFTAARAAVEAEQAAAAALMPRRDQPYDWASTYARSTLIQRGWTPAHIKRLLGDPDHLGPGARGQSYRYGIDRVEQAEAHDPALRTRLAAVDAQRRSEQEQRQAARAAACKEKRRQQETAERDRDARLRVAAATRPMFRTDPLHGWCVDGPDLTPGQAIDVARRDGSTETVTIARIVRDDGAVRRATFTRTQATAASGGLTRWWPRASAPTTGTVMQDHRGAGLVVVTGIRTDGQWGRRGDDEAPSIAGSQWLGHEGELGCGVELRPASTEEAAAFEAAARESAELARRAEARRGEHREALEAIASRSRHLPDGEEPPAHAGAEEHLIQSIAPGWEGGDVRTAYIVHDTLAVIRHDGSMPGWSLVEGEGVSDLIRAATLPPERRRHTFIELDINDGIGRDRGHE